MNNLNNSAHHQDQDSNSNDISLNLDENLFKLIDLKNAHLKIKDMEENLDEMNKESERLKKKLSNVFNCDLENNKNNKSNNNFEENFEDSNDRNKLNTNLMHKLNNNKEKNRKNHSMHALNINLEENNKNVENIKVNNSNGIIIKERENKKGGNKIVIRKNISDYEEEEDDDKEIELNKYFEIPIELKFRGKVMTPLLKKAKFQLNNEND